MLCLSRLSNERPAWTSAMRRPLPPSFPLTALALLLLSGQIQAAAEKPLFSRHVEAVFSRLGCNGGTCHGSVKGQNGFQLSLFSADPQLDHERLLRGGGG